MASIVIPAHDEEAVIGRLLDQLLDDGAHPLQAGTDVVVVCNGCTDATAERARRQGVVVLEIPQPSKHLALVSGDEVAAGFPRLYVDADVELSSSAANALFAALDDPAVHAVAPARRLALSHSAWLVRAFYAQWQQLPEVAQGLFGRGVLGVDEVGFQRLKGRPDVLGDDLYLHQQFAAGERRILVDVHATIHPPRTVADLLRRRTRAAMGNTQLTASSGLGSSTTSSVRALAARGLLSPRQLPGVAAYVSVVAAARLQARRRRSSSGSTWLRDTSSRLPPPGAAAGRT